MSLQVLNVRDKVGKFGREIRVQIFSLSLNERNNTIKLANSHVH